MRRHWLDSVQTSLRTPKMKRKDNLTTCSNECVDLIKHFEGVKLKSYQDSVGVWTIGYGSTLGIKEGVEISEQEAEDLLIHDISRFESGVSDLINVPLYQHEYDALVSFSFNLGSGALQRSTMRSLINNRRYEGAAEEFGKWVYAGGNILLGLQRRRDAERLMFLGEDWQNYRRDW